MPKTWTITQEHTVVTRFVVEGATEDEAITNWHNEKLVCEPEEVDFYDHYMTAIEEDIPDANV